MKAASNNYVILDHAVGWRQAAGGTLAEASDGSIRLGSLPGRSEPLVGDELQSRLACPSALAVDRRGRLLVADAGADLVRVLDLALPALTQIASFGGKGSAPRRLREPRGVTALSSAVAVSDTANHRVTVVADAQSALLKVWGATDALGRPIAGDGPLEFRYPWALASDNCGNILVVDRGNHRIQRITSSGDFLGEIGADCLADPTRLAIGPDGVVAVVDIELKAVLIFSAERPAPRALIDAGDPRAVAFGDDGRLFVGDALGLIHVYSRNGSTGRYERIGQGDTNVTGEVVDLAWIPGTDPFLAAILRENELGSAPKLWRISPNGLFVSKGSLVTLALDSGIDGCQWHRILASAEMPSSPAGVSSGSSASGTTSSDQNSTASIEIESYTSDVVPSKDWTPADTDWTICALTGDDDPDCLVQSDAGRYLWLRLKFRSNGLASPVLHRIKAFFPRSSYVQYLPAIYQEDTESRQFLDRFLSIFQTTFDAFDDRIDNVWQLFDPASVPESYFDWLASWLALVVEPDSVVEQECRGECSTGTSCLPTSEASGPLTPSAGWSSSKKRQMLKDAFRAYQRRGTVCGVEQVIRDYTGLQFAKILEHFKLRRWPVLSIVDAGGEPATPSDVQLPLDGTVRLWSRDFYKRLQLTSYSQIGFFNLTSTPVPIVEPFDWGANRFTVFFPSSPYAVDETKRKVQAVVDREKPAHTQAELCPVLPRLRVGVQATVGVDAAVGGISHLVLNSLSTLNYDAILSCSNDERQLRARGAAQRPRAGVTTKLS